VKVVAKKLTTIQIRSFVQLSAKMQKIIKILRKTISGQRSEDEEPIPPPRPTSKHKSTSRRGCGFYLFIICA
jgi:hypothetical protein